jgi:hypothetical protein
LRCKKNKSAIDSLYELILQFGSIDVGGPDFGSSADVGGSQWASLESLGIAGLAVDALRRSKGHNAQGAMIARCPAHSQKVQPNIGMADKWASPADCGNGSVPAKALAEASGMSCKSAVFWL